MQKQFESTNSPEYIVANSLQILIGKRVTISNDRMVRLIMS